MIMAWPFLSISNTVVEAVPVEVATAKSATVLLSCAVLVAEMERMANGEVVPIPSYPRLFISPNVIDGAGEFLIH